MKKQIPNLTVILVLSVVTIYFGFNVSALDQCAGKSLDKIVSASKSFSDYTIHLSGHTDNTGSDSYNEQLSLYRVNAVKMYLIAKGIDSTKIIFDTYGERQPIVSNSSESKRALNRRVEVTISGQEPASTPPQNTLSVPQVKDSLITEKPEHTVIPAIEKESKKQVKEKKSRRRLIWTGWRTGFHWSTAGGN